jgi:hypothetical protein
MLLEATVMGFVIESQSMLRSSLGELLSYGMMT